MEIKSVIKVLKRMINPGLVADEVNALRKAISLLEKLEKKGIWLTEEHIQGGLVDRWHNCSECGWSSGMVSRRYTYCPGCGRRMRFSDE